LSVIRRSFGLSAASKYTQFMLVLGSNMVIARLLTPEEIGVYAVAAVLAGIAQIFRDLGIGQYLIREPEITEPKLRAAFTLMTTMAWTLGTGLALSAGYLATFYEEPALRTVLRIQALSFFIIPFGAISLTLLKRDFRFGANYVVDIAASATQITIAITLAAIGFGAPSLAWGSVAGVLVTSIGAVLARRGRFAFRPSLKGARAILRFGGYITATNLLGNFNRDITELMIGKWMGMSSLAYFSKALLPNTAFSQLMMGALRPVLLPAFSKKIREHDFRQPFLYGISCLTAVAFPSLLLAAFLADWIVILLFGSQWGQTVEPMRFFAISAAIWSTTALSSPLLVAMGHPQVPMKIQLVTVPLRIGLIALAIPHGLVMIAQAWLLSVILGAALSFYMVGRLSGIRLREIGGATAPAVFLGGPIAVLVGSVAWWIGPDINAANGIVVLLTAGTSFSLIWGLALLALKHPLYLEFRGLLGWARRRAERTYSTGET
jgi:O-antigen/teichoic acid export membrane protein